MTCPIIHSHCDSTTNAMCVCDMSYTSCSTPGGTACVSLTADPNNCGACGTVCDATMGYTCLNSTCVCGAGMYGLCPGVDGGADVCSDPTSDQHNCGFCGNDCKELQCSNGSCTCNAPFNECIPTLPDGGYVPDGGIVTADGGVLLPDHYCANISNDIDNCGKCGGICGNPAQSHDARAMAWACVSMNGGPGICACQPGFFECQTSASAPPNCVNLATDSLNCGSCNNACVGGKCNNSKCDCTDPGYVLCTTSPDNDPDKCHLPPTSNTHCAPCGSASQCAGGDPCGVDCTAISTVPGPFCDNGTCACTLNKDAGTICVLPDAGGTPFCTDLSSDTANCGSCGNTIETPPFNSCSNGRQSCNTATGEQLCAVNDPMGMLLPDASFCTNTNHGDPLHCGDCFAPFANCNNWNGTNSVCFSAACSCPSDVTIADDGGHDGGPAPLCVVTSNQGMCSCDLTGTPPGCADPGPISWSADIFPLFGTLPDGGTAPNALGCTAAGCHAAGAVNAGFLDLSDVDAGYTGLVTGPLPNGKTCTTPPIPATVGAFDCPCTAMVVPGANDPNTSVLLSILKTGNFPNACNNQAIHQDSLGNRLKYATCAQLIVANWIDGGALP
jgi:hypothetical protein